MLLRKFVIGLSMLLADIVLLSCCLYLAVFVKQADYVQPNPFIWFILIIIGYLINLFVVNKKKNIALLLMWNVCWMVITSILASTMFYCEPASIPLKVFLCVVLIAIQGHGIAQALLPQKAEVCLTLLDALIVIFSVFLAMCHMTDLTGVLSLQILGFVSVGYTLAALIFLRTSEENVAVAEGNSVSERIKVFGLLGGIVAICCIICASLSIMAKNATHGLVDVILLMLQGLKTGLTDMWNVIGNLLLKIPMPDNSDAEIPFISTGETTAEQTGANVAKQLPEWLFPLIVIIIIAVIAIVVIKLIWKLRKKKIQKKGTSYRKVQIETQTIKTQKDSAFNRWLAKIKLRIKMFQLRKTPEGLAVLIRKSGKSVGLAMQPEDTWHGFVEKLTPYGDSETLQILAEYMKRYFYSGQTEPLTRQQYQTFAGALKHLKVPEKKETFAS